MRKLIAALSLVFALAGCGSYQTEGAVADAGTNMQGCLDALPSTGGVCNFATVPGGNIDTPLTIGRGKTLILGADRFYAGAACVNPTSGACVTVQDGGRLQGFGGVTPGWGTEIRARAGFTGTSVVSCTAAAGPSAWCHWARIENLTVFADKANQTVAFDGIRLDHCGEGTVVRDVFVHSSKGPGIHLAGGSQAGCYGLQNIDLQSNDGCGVKIDGPSGAFSKVEIDGISGDKNQPALVCDNSGDYHELTITGAKAEDGLFGAGFQDFLILDGGGSTRTATVNIVGAHLVGNGSGTQTPEAIKIVSGDVNLTLLNVHAQQFQVGIRNLAAGTTVPLEDMARVPLFAYSTEPKTGSHAGQRVGAVIYGDLVLGGVPGQGMRFGSTGPRWNVGQGAPNPASCPGVTPKGSMYVNTTSGPSLYICESTGWTAK